MAKSLAPSNTVIANPTQPIAASRVEGVEHLANTGNRPGRPRAK